MDNPPPLPDFGHIATGATMVANKAQKPPNVQLFNSAQTLANINNALNTLSDSIATFTETVERLRTDVNAQITRLRADVRNDTNALRAEMNRGFQMG